ncbi:uncharacterized protein LOC144478223 [Augochlora pura]
MNPSKWNFVSATMVSLISMVILGSIATGSEQREQEQQQQQQKHHVAMVPSNQSGNAPPYWEYVLRESVFRTISPPPSPNINLYRRLLDAPLYGGPFPTGPNDAAGYVLSRGDIYYLPNNDWLLCQEGCINCDVCTEYTHPVLKWVLRMVKRRPIHGPEHQDLQLTLIPRIDGSYLSRSLWPRSYVYVTTPGQLEKFWNDRIGHQGPASLDDSIGQPRTSGNFDKTEEESPERRVRGQLNTTTTEYPESDSSGSATPEDKEKNTTSGSVSNPTQLPDRPDENHSVSKPVIANGRNQSAQLLPKLILGTDQQGQKHLVHVVPADGNSTNPARMGPLNGSSRFLNRTAYQRIMKRIHDSLSTNKKSIERFLDPLPQTDHRQEVYQQQETRNNLAELKQLIRLHRSHNGTTGSENNRRPFALDWRKQSKKSDDEVDGKTFVNDIITADHASNNHVLDQDRNVDNASTKQDSKRGPRMFKVVVTTESTTKSFNKSDAVLANSKPPRMTD